jgi:pantothenate kinase type III
MILVFDVGNSNIVVGVLKEGKLINHWRLRTDNMRTSDEYGMHMMSLFKYHHLDMADIKAVVISSVVPSLNIELEGMISPSEMVIAKSETARNPPNSILRCSVRSNSAISLLHPVSPGGKS